MTEKTQRDFTYVDWLRFYEYHPIAKAIRKRYKKKLDKLTGGQFMMCQGEMWRELGKAYREFKEQHKKARRQSLSAKLKDRAQLQETRARAGRGTRSPVKASIDKEDEMRSNPISRKRKGYRVGSKAWREKMERLGREKW